MEAELTAEQAEVNRLKSDTDQKKMEVDGQAVDMNKQLEALETIATKLEEKEALKNQLQAKLAAVAQAEVELQAREADDAQHLAELTEQSTALIEAKDNANAMRNELLLAEKELERLFDTAGCRPLLGILLLSPQHVRIEVDKLISDLLPLLVLVCCRGGHQAARRFRRGSKSLCGAGGRDRAGLQGSEAGRRCPGPAESDYRANAAAQCSIALGCARRRSDPDARHTPQAAVKMHMAEMEAKHAELVAAVSEEGVQQQALEMWTCR
jgi:hypothetical protein